jgi:hypothetical protein
VNILNQLNINNLKLKLMKNTIYKIGFLLLLFAIVISCESPEAETNYTPASYEYPAGITLVSNTKTNSSFQFTYSNSGGGEGYYVVVEGGSDAPTSDEIFKATGAGLIQSGDFALTGESVTISINDLCDGTTYDIYAVQMTSDNFLSENPEKISVTTTENANIAGTYTTVTNGYSGFWEVDAVNFTSEVTITDNGDSTFTFSDTTAGIYPDPDFYGYYNSPAVPFTFDVPCNEISAVLPSPFNNCCDDVIDFKGVINADGTLSVHWESAFGEIMDVVYTKQ